MLTLGICSGLPPVILVYAQFEISYRIPLLQVLNQKEREKGSPKRQA